MSPKSNFPRDETKTRVHFDLKKNGTAWQIARWWR
jgi:hypothetical protein